MSQDRDGIRYPAIDQLAKITKSKYKLVLGAAVRARQIEEEAKEKDKDVTEVTTVKNPHSKKSIGLALEEIYAGKTIIK